MINSFLRSALYLKVNQESASSLFFRDFRPIVTDFLCLMLFGGRDARCMKRTAKPTAEDCRQSGGQSAKGDHKQR